MLYQSYKNNTLFSVIFLLMLCAISYADKAKAEALIKEQDSLKQVLSSQTLSDTDRVKTLNVLVQKIMFDQPSEALKYVHESYNLSTSIGDTLGQLRTLLLYGDVYMRKSNYVKAISYYLKGLKMAKKLTNIYAQIAVFNSLGVIYTDLKKNDIAKVYLNRALQLDTLIGGSTMRGVIFNSLGVVEKGSGNLDKSIQYYEDELAFGKQYNDNRSIYSALMNIGNVYLDLDSIDKGLSCYQEVLNLNIINNNYIRYICNANVGHIYRLKKDYVQALKYLNEARVLFETAEIRGTIPEVYSELAKVYAEQGDYKQAYELYQIFHRQRETVINEKVTEQISEMQVKYETDEKDEEIQELNRSKELHQAQLSKERIMRNAIIVVLTLALIILIISVRNVLHKQKVNKLLKLQKEQIEQQNREIADKNKILDNYNKELIKENIYARYEVLKSKVNPHFLFNSLSSLAALIPYEPQTALEFVSRFSQLYRTIIVAKEDGIIAGLVLGEFLFKRVDPLLEVKLFFNDGDIIKKGDIVMEIQGSSIAMLTAERTVLNFMQRLSGVATQTTRYAETLKGLHTQILDTRKTTPGMRLLEKWAVKTGGGANHRIGLYDMILIKDNHVDFAGGIKAAIEHTSAYLKRKSLNLKIEIETRNLDEVKQVLEAGGIHRIMLDNFNPALLREGVALINKHYETEASGGITLSTLREYAETGVDFISSGALTHSVKSLDISMRTG